MGTRLRVMQPQAGGHAAAILIVGAVAAAASITVMETAVALAGLAWVVALTRVAPRLMPRPQRSLALLCGALVVWSVISAAASAQPVRSLGGSGSVLLWIVVPLASTVLDDRLRRRVQALLLVEAGLLGLWACAEAYFWWAGGGEYMARARGPFSSHMTLAGFLLVATLQAFPDLDLRPLFPARYRHLLGARLWPGRVAAVLGLTGLVATLARSAVLAALSGCIVLLMTGRSRHRRAATLAAVTVLVMAGCMSVALPGALAERSAWARAALASGQDRMALWQAGLAMIAERPVVGIGANRVRHEAARFVAPGHRRPGPPAHLHSAPLTVAAERGLPAVGILALFYGLTFWRYRHAVVGDDRLRRGALAAVVGFLVMGLFEDNLGDSEVLFVHLVTMAALWVPSPAVATTGSDPVVP